MMIQSSFDFRLPPHGVQGTCGTSPYNPCLHVKHDNEVPQPFFVFVAIARNILSKDTQISSIWPMSVLFLAIQCGAIFYILKRLLRYLSASSKVGEAARGGCEPAHVIPRKGPLGIANAMAHSQARDQCRWPNYLVEIFDTVGENINTAWEGALGSNYLLTRDPENSKDGLATQAEAFILGEGRSENFMDLLGRGVITSEGKASQHSRALVRPPICTPNHLRFEKTGIPRTAVMAEDTR